jgi:hypothetical protein
MQANKGHRRIAIGTLTSPVVSNCIGKMSAKDVLRFRLRLAISRSPISCVMSVGAALVRTAMESRQPAEFVSSEVFDS